MHGAVGFRRESDDRDLADETLNSFEEAWLLKRPKCGNRSGFLDDRGQIQSAIYLNHMDREQALCQDYIQLNHSRAVTMMSFDIDSDYSVEELGELVTLHGMIPPNLIMRNSMSGHCHVIYLISGKVYRNPLDMGASHRFLESVRDTMTAVLDADPDYNGLLVQNPFSTRWELYVSGGIRHNLGDLMKNFRGIMLERGLGKAVKRQRTEIGGEWDSEGAAEGSRNCMMFESLMRIVPREYREAGYPKISGRSSFVKSIEDLALGTLNQDIAMLAGKPPMKDSEVKGIVKSVTSFVFRNNTETRFLAHQRVMGKLRRKVDYDRVIDQYTNHNRPISELAQEYGVTYSAIYRILRVNNIEVDGQRKVRKWTAVREQLQVVVNSKSGSRLAGIQRIIDSQDPKAIAAYRTRMSRAKKAFPLWWSIISNGDRSKLRVRLMQYLRGMIKGKLPLHNLDEAKLVNDLINDPDFWVDAADRTRIIDITPQLVNEHRQRQRAIRMAFWREVLEEEERVKEELGLAA